jgi:hypothetical protein
MNWIESPESSNIARFTYVEASHVLKVEFKDGAIYDYFDVPLEVFQSMRAAPSKGKFLAQSIRAVYRYART